MTAIAAVPRAAEGRLITVRPAPRREPPFDDERAHRSALGVLDCPLPFPEPLHPEPAPPLHTRLDPDLPEPARWARGLLIGIIETAKGHRAPQQLLHLFSAVVAMRVGSDVATTGRGRKPHWLHAATVRTVRATQPCQGVAEVAAVLDVRGRVHAVAMRIERRDGQWRCTQLQLG
ncbi:MAG TPA: Rv3235 family protein [Jatrophihabitantaceae bacterium]|nr:Rv3235 family protein [Jatrophihabitantaceae bacterium]